MNPMINSLLTLLNSVGEAFCSHAAGVFVQTAILVAVLYAVDLLLRKRVRAVFRYCVWLLVLVKLILPPTLSLPTGVGYWAGEHLPAALSAPDRPFDVPDFEHMGASVERPNVEPLAEPAEFGPPVVSTNAPLPALTWKAILFILWLAGVLAFLALLVQRAMFVRGLIAASTPATAEFAGILEQCRRQIGVRSKIKLRISETISSPAVCGFFRPIILIPAALVGKLSAEGLRAILIHELAHIKRGDLWVNSIQTLLQVVYFYNPFVWFANSMIRKVCEEAVDETVLVTLGGTAKDYSNTLIDIGEMAFWKADLGLRLIGVAESRKALQWRIRQMLNRPIPKSSKLGILGIAELLVVAAILLPMAKAERSREDAEPVAVSSEGKQAQSLCKAAYAGDIERVKQLIAEGADVNAEGAIGWTPLLGAVNKGHLQVVKLLLEIGAKVNNVGDGWYTPLYYAVWNGDREMVKTLISNGADVNIEPKEGDYRPLVYAVWHCHPEIIRILVEAGANVNAEDESGWTALHQALKRADADMAKQFIGTGVNISTFHEAILEGDLAKVKQLVEDGMGVDAPDKLGWTPTYWAVSAGQKELAEYFLGKGADFTAKADAGHTVLHQASRAGMVEIVKSLIAKGAEVDVKCEAGVTPLQYAAGAGQEGVVRLLVANGAKVNHTAKDGRHPLGDAAAAGHEDVVKLLLASGAEVNLQAEDKMRCGTALHAAAAGGHSTIVDVLIAHGGYVNAACKHGTPLHLAFVPRAGVEDKTREQMVTKLLAHGANVNAKELGRGWTPLHTAASMGQVRIAGLLITAGADVDATDNETRTPLWYAQKRRHAEIVEMIRKHGAK